MSNGSESVAIVYFDGLCNVCNRFVDFLIRHDHKRRMKFAPLQGQTAHRRLSPHLIGELSTVVFERDGIIKINSSAAICAIASCGGVFALLAVFLLVPRFVRDGVYRWVANHRYLFAGHRSTCRLPSTEERTLFLD